MPRGMECCGVKPPGRATLVFYDGECPLCRVEVRRLLRRAPPGRLDPVDISAPGFDARQFGLDAGECRRQLHVLRPDGVVLRGMEAVRAAWRAAGLGWLAAPTAWAPLRGLFDRLYAVFARHRLRWGAAVLRLTRGRATACARCGS